MKNFASIVLICAIIFSSCKSDSGNHGSQTFDEKCVGLSNVFNPPTKDSTGKWFLEFDPIVGTHDRLACDSATGFAAFEAKKCFVQGDSIRLIE